MQLMPMYWVRVVGGTLYLIGMLLFGVNILMTWQRAPGDATRSRSSQARRAREPPSPVADGTRRRSLGALRSALGWHRRWEAAAAARSRCWVVVAVVVASLFEIMPTFLIRSNVPTIASVKPYTPLELAGRDIYIREGCYNCHSQMIRPFRSETERYGEYSKPGEFVYDHPFQWGSRRIGPDLAREGGKLHDLWHVRHMENPRAVTPSRSCRRTRACSARPSTSTASRSASMRWPCWACPTARR